MSLDVKAITVCVGYDDLLAITLPQNLLRFSSYLIVTSPGDVRTQAVARDYGAQVYLTDAFTRHGAKFNKGLALEEAFDVAGRNGWMAVLDADTLLPPLESRPLVFHDNLKPGVLYSARRRMLDDPSTYTPSLNWKALKVCPDRVFAGYFHLFHSDDIALRVKPWYDVTFAHAGGGDGYFQTRWPIHRKVYLPWEVLHLGPRDSNWWGRATPRVDGQVNEEAAENARLMAEYSKSKGWGQRVRLNNVNDRVDVPGHQRTKFDVK